MRGDAIDRLLESERKSALAAMREMLRQSAEAVEKMANLAIAADKRAMIACDERDAAYLRTDELANRAIAAENRVRELEARLAEYETATQPPAVA